jgi:ABC-2 type transport system ATP-binding protein
MRTDAAVTFSDVSSSYGKQQVLSGLNFDVQAGEFLGLVGVNGAGKSTLIKCLLDFTQLKSGSISIFGQSNLEVVSRQRLAFLPEKFVPPYYLTGTDYLKYMSALYHRSYEQAEVEKMLAVLDLDVTALDKSVRQLSKGMSQKLGLAACLMSDKDLFVLDEPMSGLDPKARAYLKQYLIDLKEKGKTLFFSTHMLVDVETLCDKVAILHNGNIQFVGSPIECCDKYETKDFEQAYLRCVGGERV